MTAPHRPAASGVRDMEDVMEEVERQLRTLRAELEVRFTGQFVDNAISALDGAIQAITTIHAEIASRDAALVKARADALEEAAVAMENLGFLTDIDELMAMTKQDMSVRTCHEGAAAIRALATQGEGA